MEGLDKSSRSPSLLSRALSFLNQVFTCRASTCSFDFRCSKLLRISAYLVKSFRSGLGVSSYHFLRSGISTEVLKTIFFPRGVMSSFLEGDIEPSSSCSLLSWECSYQAAKSLIFSDDRRQGYWSLEIWESMPWECNSSNKYLVIFFNIIIMLPMKLKFTLMMCITTTKKIKQSLIKKINTQSVHWSLLLDDVTLWITWYEVVGVDIFYAVCNSYM